MLLPGHLPNVPLLPAHMSFLGKDLNTAPQIRVARAMHVKDVMTKDVITVRQGTALPAAAELMVAKKVSGVPVIDAEDRLVGILTEADFLSAMNLDSGHRRQRAGDHRAQAAGEEGDGHDRRRHHDPLADHDRRRATRSKPRSGGWTRTRSSGSSSPTTSTMFAASSPAPT